MSDAEDDEDCRITPPPGFLNEEGEEVTLEQTTPPSSAHLSPIGRNPFRHGAQPGSLATHRVHFPAFTEAILDARSTPSPSSSSKSNSPDGLNRSNVSSTGASYASSLNMSIGAKAALNEHLRHIAKFGFDESRSNSNSSNTSPSHGGTGDDPNPKEEDQQKKPKAVQTPPYSNPLDGVWDRLLDNDQENYQSPDISATSNKSPPDLDRMDTIVSVSTGDLEGTEAIEVSPRAETQRIQSPIRSEHLPFAAWDLPHYSQQDDAHSRSSKSTSSYFNSSRVNELQTPERNRTTAAAGLSGVTLRHAAAFPTSPSILEEPSLLADQSSLASPNMAQMFHALTIGSSPPPLDLSFAAADLSRISAGNDGDHSPDNSFQRQPLVPQHHSLFTSWDEEDLHHQGAMLDVPPPPPPPPHPPNRRRYPFQQQRNDPRSTSGDLLVHHNMTRSLSPPKRRPLLQKQRSCPESQSTAYHPWNPPGGDEQVFSAAAQKAGLLALAKQSQLIHGEDPPPPTEGTLVDFFHDYLPPESASTAGSQRTPPLLFGTQEVSVDDLSTIQNESSSAKNTSSSSSSMKRRAAAVARRQSSPREALPIQTNTLSSPSALNKSTLSSSSSSTGVNLDRRRFRTVVPSRVFLKEATKEGFFPSRGDSFSAEDPPAVAAATSQEESALLQNSFEAAYQVSLLEDQELGNQEEQEQPMGKQLQSSQQELEHQERHRRPSERQEQDQQTGERQQQSSHKLEHQERRLC